MSKSNITVIIPVHELDSTTKKSLETAIDSVVSQSVKADEILIVGPEKVVNELKDSTDIFKGHPYRLVLNEGATDFSSQTNLGVEKCETEWFTLLEMDDEYSKNWVANVVKYRATYGDVDLFLPIIIDTDTNSNFIGFSNEAVWAAEFSEEMGILDNNKLLEYQNFNFDGMAMRKSQFEEIGGLKPSMKLTFIYEFLLRATYFSTRVMVIPKFGYKHVNQREGSLFHTYKTTLSADESRWWMSLAKKEYFHTKDRGITYDK